MITLGERLAAARQLRGLKQSDLGNAVGLSRQWISVIENNNALPTPEQQEKIEGVLGISLDDPRLMSLLQAA